MFYFVLFNLSFPSERFTKYERSFRKNYNFCQRWCHGCKISNYWETQTFFNPFSTNVPLLYPLKTSENRRFSDAFRGYRSETSIENGLNECVHILQTSKVTDVVLLSLLLILNRFHTLLAYFHYADVSGGKKC